MFKKCKAFVITSILKIVDILLTIIFTELLISIWKEYFLFETPFLKKCHSPKMNHMTTSPNNWFKYQPQITVGGNENTNE